MPDIPQQISGLSHAERPLALVEVTHSFDARLQTGRLENYRPVPLGFPGIDECLGGGAHAEDLVLIGGVQNVGKTTLALQAARNMAVAGQVLPIMVCYEHSPETLLHRLICQESVDDPDEPAPRGVTRAEIESAVLRYYDATHGSGRPRQDDHREHMADGNDAPLDLDWLTAYLPAAGKAIYRMQEYQRCLWLARGDGRLTTVERLESYVEMANTLGFRRVALIVDYAQRVPVLSFGGDLTELQRIDLVMRGLKGIALKLGVPVIAVAAADAEGLRQQRIHVENLWGPATVQYEPDTAIILNRDTLHPPVNGAKERGDARTVRLAIEKNRGGPSEVEFRHRLHGQYYCLSRHGERVADDESFQAERIVLRAKRQTSVRSGLNPAVAMLLWAALEHPERDRDDLVRELLRRALLADDGGASLTAEITERLGLQNVPGP